MKKILTHLTGIVFLLAILVAGSCQDGKTTNDPTNPENETTKVIKVQEILIDGRMHLEMWNEENPKCVVIDALTTYVNRGNTVRWEKADGAKLQSILQIRPVKEGGTIIPKGVRAEDEGMTSISFKVPAGAKPGIEKYEIIFMDEAGGIWIIDPYLKLPPP